jgi:hypothetical protein
LKLDDSFACELSDSLKTYNRTVTVVNLEGNDIRATGISRWSECLEVNNKLIEVRLGQQENHHHGREAELKIVAAMKANKTLRKLTYGWLDDINNQTVETITTENGLRRFQNK